MIGDILIHTCCADCLLNTLKYLRKEDIVNVDSRVVSFFFNPNIHPRSEFLERLNAVKKVLLKEENVELVIPDYSPKEYFKSIEGKEERCMGCWELRLRNLFEYAKENGFKDITSTLLVSRYQEREKIKEIAKELNEEYGLNFIDVDSRHNCRNTGFYKQNYCGCCYSLVEKLSTKQN
jgi:hypothetical protein